MLSVGLEPDPPNVPENVPAMVYTPPKMSQGQWHHVEGLAEAIEEAGRQLAATQPQPDSTGKKHTAP